MKDCVVYVTFSCVCVTFSVSFSRRRDKLQAAGHTVLHNINAANLRESLLLAYSQQTHLPKSNPKNLTTTTITTTGEKELASLVMFDAIVFNFPHVVSLVYIYIYVFTTLG